MGLAYFCIDFAYSNSFYPYYGQDSYAVGRVITLDVA